MTRQSSAQRAPARMVGPRLERRGGYWTAWARGAIDETTRAWLRERGYRLVALMDLDAREQRDLLLRVRAGYPFGERRGWPYQVWLREVRDWRASLAQPGPPPPPPPPETCEEYQVRTDGQTRLELY